MDVQTYIRTYIHTYKVNSEVQAILAAAEYIGLSYICKYYKPAMRIADQHNKLTALSTHRNRWGMGRAFCIGITI